MLIKKLLLLPLFVLFIACTVWAQEEIQEAYFHELKGMEDSTGVTHLFYRLKVDKTNQFECDGEVQTFYSTTSNIYHLSPTQSDSLKFLSYSGESCTGDDTRTIMDYTFYENNPSKWITSLSSGYAYGVEDYLDNSLGFHIPIVTKQNPQNSKQDYVPSEFLLSPNGDSLYIHSYNFVTIPFSGQSEQWPVFETYDDFVAYADSVSLGLKVIAIHPNIDSLYFAVNSSGDLFKSNKFSQNFTLVDSIGYFRNLHFDADSLHIYSLQNSTIRRSDSLGIKDSWESVDIDFNTSASKFISIDKSASGKIFISDSTSILSSNNYGDTFTDFLTVEDDITGLYKKPDSDKLYVLTREELLEVNMQTKETTSLKKIPVSNEPEPSEIPKQISLEQNYPNPFNPSTVISYQLAVNSLVQLEVFDVTGRKVAVLVDGEAKPAGRHELTFDAAELSSGMYFYRLQSGGKTLTQKMMLVK